MGNDLTTCCDTKDGRNASENDRRTSQNSKLMEPERLSPIQAQLSRELISRETSKNEFKMAIVNGGVLAESISARTFEKGSILSSEGYTLSGYEPLIVSSKNVAADGRAITGRRISFAESRVPDYTNDENLAAISYDLLTGMKEKLYHFDIDGLELANRDSEITHEMTLFWGSYPHDQNQILILEGEYMINCSAHKFSDFLNDFDKIMEMDEKILEYDIIHVGELDKEVAGVANISQTTTTAENEEKEELGVELVYEKTRRMMLSVPRDFMLYRCYQSLPDGTFADAFSSIDYAAKGANDDCIRARVLAEGHLIQPNGENVSHVRFYQEIDYKSNESPQLLRTQTLNEVRNYISRVITMLESKE